MYGSQHTIFSVHIRMEICCGGQRPIDPHVGVFASYDYTSKMKEDGESISWGDYADYMEVDYNHFDAGMNIGVGVWYDRFNLDLTYQRGFIDAFSDADGFKTSNFMIRLGIAF